MRGSREFSWSAIPRFLIQKDIFNVIRSLRLAFASGLFFGSLALAGCSGAPPEPPMIEGQTPADFREDMEKKLTHPLGDPPAKTPLKKGQNP